MSNDAKVWKHDELLSDLAAHLAGNGRRVWCDMQLGPAGSPRPDIFSILFSFAHFRPISYEVKISRADLMRDLNAQKYTKYHRFSAGVFFAFPTGMAKKEEIPAECGIMVRGDSGWRALRSPRFVRIETLPQEAWMKLVIDGVERHFRSQPRARESWVYSESLRKKLGKEVASLIGDKMSYENTVTNLKASCANLQEEVRAAKKVEMDRMRAAVEREQVTMRQAITQAGKDLGLGDDASAYDISHHLAQVRQKLDDPVGRGEVVRLLRSLEAVQSTIDRIVSDAKRSVGSSPELVQIPI